MSNSSRRVVVLASSLGCDENRLANARLLPKLMMQRGITRLKIDFFFVLMHAESKYHAILLVDLKRHVICCGVKERYDGAVQDKRVRN